MSINPKSVDQGRFSDDAIVRTKFVARQLDRRLAKYTQYLAQMKQQLAPSAFGESPPLLAAAPY